ncbi:MAG TPA: helix-turn-helix transcriptional regulator [Roseiarcus sp.]|nr:helix-turn-helix transcriptional regulator [Roseiarcus sp.]
MADIRKILGENVRRARRAMGVSQEALADMAKIDRTYVSGVERGVRNPSVKIVARFAKALKTTPDALLASPSSRSTGAQ